MVMIRYKTPTSLSDHPGEHPEVSITSQSRSPVVIEVEFELALTVEEEVRGQ